MSANNFELPADAADMMPRELAARVQTDITPVAAMPGIRTARRRARHKLKLG